MKKQKSIVSIRKELSKEQACEILGDAWWDGKNAKLQRTDHDYLSNDDGSGFVEISIPLQLIRPNENGARYDATVNEDRMRAYASYSIDTPIHLLFGSRAIKIGMTLAGVMDGGHRISAARLNNEENIIAIMQRSDLDRLCLINGAEIYVKKSFSMKPS